jgi:hypothetical protein
MNIAEVLRGFVEQQRRLHEFLRKQEMRRDVRQHKERHMSTPETSENENHLPIRFDGGDGANDRLLQGTIIRCVDGHWSDRDGVAFSPDTQMIVLGTTQALQRWQVQTPIETILKKPARGCRTSRRSTPRFPNPSGRTASTATRARRGSCSTLCTCSTRSTRVSTRI